MGLCVLFIADWVLFIADWILFIADWVLDSGMVSHNVSPVLSHEEHLLFELVLFLVKLVDFFFKFQNVLIGPSAVGFELFSGE